MSNLIEVVAILEKDGSPVRVSLPVERIEVIRQPKNYDDGVNCIIILASDRRYEVQTDYYEVVRRYEEAAAKPAPIYYITPQTIPASTQTE